MSGVVYILRNAREPDLIKIGKARSAARVEQRAREHPKANGYKIEWQVHSIVDCNNPMAVESAVLRKFRRDHREVRVKGSSSAREVFRCDPREALSEIEQAARKSREPGPPLRSSFSSYGGSSDYRPSSRLLHKPLLDMTPEELSRHRAGCFIEPEPKPEPEPELRSYWRWPPSESMMPQTPVPDMTPEEREKEKMRRSIEHMMSVAGRILNSKKP